MTVASPTLLSRANRPSPFGKPSTLRTLGTLAGQAINAPSRFTLGVASQIPGMQFLKNPAIQTMAKYSDDIARVQGRLAARLPSRVQRQLGVSRTEAVSGALLIGALAFGAYKMGWLDLNKLSQDLRNQPK